MKNILVWALFATLAACKPASKCVETLDPACSCIQVYDPVCGCNNKTYGNACMAECAGIKTYTQGACPEKSTAAPLEGTVWQLTILLAGPEAQTVPTDVTISIKLGNGRVEGRGGCNNIGGRYQLKGNNLSISGLMSTKMYCEHAQKWEDAFLRSLEKSQSYSIQGGVLDLNCGDMGSLIFRPN